MGTFSLRHLAPAARATMQAGKITRRPCLAFGVAALAGMMMTDMPTAGAHQFSSDGSCLPFLSSGSSKESPDGTSQRAAGFSNAAGKAATLGLLLGLNVALGPAEDLQKPDAQGAGMTALDIQRYHACKKEQALRLSG